MMLSKYIVHSFDWSNFTALHWAAKRGYSEMCRYLLDKKAIPSAEDAMERTPLWYAITQSHVECAFDLVMHGATLPWGISIQKLVSSQTHYMILNLVKLLKPSLYCQALVKRKENRRQIKLDTIKKVKDLIAQHEEAKLRDTLLLSSNN